jgi:hypothetical protein
MKRSDNHSFIATGGETAALTQSHDWEKTPIGPAESWSPTLRVKRLSASI